MSAASLNELKAAAKESVANETGVISSVMANNEINQYSESVSEMTALKAFSV
jgi:hypothetical protein